MEFTHIANPVRVKARRITSMSHTDQNGINDTVGLQFEGGGDIFTTTPAMTARYWPKVGDYFVTQEDGYEYLNPKDVFERKYAAV